MKRIFLPICALPFVLNALTCTRCPAEITEKADGDLGIVVPVATKSDWSFSLEPYAWSLGMQGTIGIKGYRTEVEFNPADILKHLDWGIFARGEVRYKKWGILADGFFAQLSDSGDLPAPIYQNTNVTVQQGLAQLALAYRVWESRLGFLDVYAGGRYNYIGLDASLDTDSQGISNLSDAIVGRIANEVSNRVTAFLDQNRAALADAIAERVTQALTPKVIAAAGKIPPYIPDKVIISTAKQVAAVVRAQAEVKVEALRGRVSAAAQNRLSAVQKRLSRALANQIETRVPASYTGTQWWIDPIIGLRGQVNVTRWLYFAAQGDVGGFGAGSEIATSLSASLGVNFTRNIFSEIGYRAFYMDYTNAGSTYDAWETGAFAGIGVRF